MAGGAGMGKDYSMPDGHEVEVGYRSVARQIAKAKGLMSWQLS